MAKTLFKFDKYTKIEVVFFLVYFYGISLLSNFEYNFWERNYIGIPSGELEFSIVYGTCNIIVFLVFYWALKFCLKSNKIWMFAVLIVSFLVSHYFYKKGSYLLISELSFLSDKIRSDAIKWYHLKRLGFTLSYMMTQLAGVSFLAYFIHSARQKEQLKALKEQQLMSELTYLKAQLQPHFFFNTLNNIYGLALKQSKDTAPLVAKLAEMMRYMLYKVDEKLVLLKDEIEFLRNYVAVENIRYRSAIKIDFDVQGIDSGSKISPLLFLPFIENAFKHGIAEEENEGFVHIVICKTGDELTLDVANSVAATKVNIGGIGLTNVKKRLEILYPGKHKLEIAKTERVYQVNLTLDMV
ncbi:sensor histidine kinase [Pedobacter namyangjuensis]|uniref:sensor histidine kinase n=1 Tax=Pedobacter namyangjuensis TaxID=600626 RepID=UPI000DE2944C|nr:sensor histidine kinase [Pedobacter namyangjuensis]